jgi:hypothetical protein
MELIIDNIFTVLRATILHPVASLLLFLPNIGVRLLQACVWPTAFTKDCLTVESMRPLDGHFKMALGCVALSWIIQLNRTMNRKLLNPSPKLSCTWSKEVVVVTGGSGGIGGELVKMLEKLGATVAIMDVVPPTFETGKCRLIPEQDIMHRIDHSIWCHGRMCINTNEARSIAPR